MSAIGKSVSFVVQAGCLCLLCGTPVVALVKGFGVVVPWTYGELAMVFVASMVVSVAAGLVEAACRGIDV